MLVQHCSHHKLGCNCQMHYLLMEAIELGSMQGSGQVISNHLVCWTIFDVSVAFGLLISNVEVSDVQMMRVHASTLASISLEQHGTFVVLREDIFLDWISLCLKKSLCPYHWGDDFVSSYHSTSVELLVFIPCFLLREVMGPSPIKKVELV